MTQGFNPLRWQCERDGCFNIKRRPKIEVFADCFPRRINFGDVDGLVELSGFFCLLEWKGSGGQIKTGQRMSFVTLTKIVGNIVFVVEGDAGTMDVKRYCIFWRGKQQKWVCASLTDVQVRIKKWASWIEEGKS